MGVPQSFAVRIKRLQLARANLVGTVLTKYDAKSVTYGYGYGAGHEYSLSIQLPSTKRQQ